MIDAATAPRVPRLDQGPRRGELTRWQSTLFLMAVIDPRFLEFGRRIAAQYDRLGVQHSIDETASEGTFRVEVAAAVERLSELSGISPKCADFIGAVEFYYSVGSFTYFRG